MLANGFRDLGGTTATLHIPIAEHLLTSAAMALKPPQSPVRDVQIEPHDGNHIAIKLKLSKPSFLPPVTVDALIEQQPVLPASPIVAFKLSAFPGLISAASFGAGMVSMFPEGVALEHERVTIDLRRIGGGVLAPYLRFIERLEFSSIEGAVIVDAKVRVSD